MKHIDLALEKNYNLFILDEVLDIISKTNLNKIFEKLKDKKLIVITHQKICLDPNVKNFMIKNNRIFKI